MADALDGFHPTIQRWFRERLGAPTAPQAQGWPLIREGRHVLIAAPTGSGKTLAAFLAGLDALLREGSELPRATRLLYISPLKALSNDVQKNLDRPLAELRALDPTLPDVRVTVRTGDTLAKDRQAMVRKHPHVLVTTPESLYILLTSESGRVMLSGVKTVIIDEIHALARDKRGAHLALSLERLEALIGPYQRIGLSATQRPMEAVARFLVGVGRECAIVDAGHRRDLDLEVVVPPTPLSAVCSHEQWAEVYAMVAGLIREHRTTLVFVNTRTLAERAAARLGEALGPDQVLSHHGSLSRHIRLEAERRLKAGELKALVATASLELGIDIGDVDLVVQLGSSRSIATLLQRVGRSGHALGKTPRGRLFPLTRDELVEAAAILAAVKKGELDRIVMPVAPLDIAAQQVVAECVARPWAVGELHACLTRAWPYRDLPREAFDRAWALHTATGLPGATPAPESAEAPEPGESGAGGPRVATPTGARGRAALLHHDSTTGQLRATRRARLVATSSGGAIPDAADYQVVVEPEGTLVGTLNEDFAIESAKGDIFQLGTTSWRILRVEPGVVRVASAEGAPPTIPFWLGEAPARTAELAAEVSRLRDAVAAVAERDGPPAAVEWLEREAGLRPAAGEQVVEYVDGGRKALGTVPTRERLVLERFFDESGGMQLVLHAPFGGRINRALGLALRKRFCVGFGFELQAAANEEAIILSLGPQHSFPLEDVFDYLKPPTAKKTLVQALLQAPMFETRWRWNATRWLLVERMRSGKKVPPALVRMRAGDLLTSAFPQAQACPETLPPGPVEPPMDHPVVRQTIHDCLNEAMDEAGYLEVVRALADGRIERRALDVPEPSPFAQGILTAQPYTFLDDAPLEERRTHAVMARRGLDRRQQDGIGALDPDAIARVREEAWPQPSSADEVHEALLWMGWVADVEADPWRPWLEALLAAGRVRRETGPLLLAPPPPVAPAEAATPATAATTREATATSGSTHAAPGAAAPAPAATSGATASGTSPGTTTSGGATAPAAHGAAAPRDAVGLRWVAVDGDPRPVDRLRGRLEALGPVVSDDPLLLQLEQEGTVLRVRFDGQDGWCHRRLLARIQRYTIERLRKEIEPVTAAQFLRFLTVWQHVDPDAKLEGPRGVAQVLRQLAGYEVPAAEWERSVLPARVKGYRREWLDQLTLSGELAWGRLWGRPGGEVATASVRVAPLCIVPRDELDLWLHLAGPASVGPEAGAADGIGPGSSGHGSNGHGASGHGSDGHGSNGAALANPAGRSNGATFVAGPAGPAAAAASLLGTGIVEGDDHPAAWARDRRLAGDGDDDDVDHHDGTGAAAGDDDADGVDDADVDGEGAEVGGPQDGAGPGGLGEASAAVKALVAHLEARGAQFQDDLGRTLGLLPTALEAALGEAVSRGLVTCDAWGAVRALVIPPSRRITTLRAFGRWSRFRGDAEAAGATGAPGAAPEPPTREAVVEAVARTLLRRTGVVFPRLLERERLPVPWRELVRFYRLLEMRGEVRGGRFVAGFAGEQYALPEAVTELRAVRRAGPRPPVEVSAADPLNLRGILTPDERVARTARRRVIVG